MLELGLDVVTLTEGVLRGAVLEGRHSIDISLIIAPVIHEFIVGTAEKVGIDFDEGLPDDTEQREDIRYTINENKARKMLEELGMEPEEMEEEEEMGASEESQMEEMQPMEAEAKPAGLMARPGGEV
jgi:transcriptional regulator of met regulon